MEYFGNPREINFQPWIPSSVHRSCVVTSRFWVNKNIHTFKYKIPMIWLESSNHRPYWIYSSLQSTSIPNPDSREESGTTFPAQWIQSNISRTFWRRDSNFRCLFEPRLLNQNYQIELFNYGGKILHNKLFCNLEFFSPIFAVLNVDFAKAVRWLDQRS